MCELNRREARPALQVCKRGHFCLGCLPAQRQRLQTQVFQPDVIEYTLGRFKADLEETLKSRRSDAQTWRQQEAAIERKIGNLTRALADGYSSAITADLSRLEEHLAMVRQNAAVGHSGG